MKRKLAILLSLLSLILLAAVPAGAAPLAGPCAAGQGYDPACDADHDGDIDVLDIQLTAGRWGASGTFVDDSWSLTGNAGTTPGTNFLGTSDNQALEVKVNGLRALLIQPNGGATPSLVGGHSSNWASNGTIGATIGGGGSSGTSCGPAANSICNNRISGAYGTIGGGRANYVPGFYGFVGGGDANQAMAAHTVVAGGLHNLAGSLFATVGGGNENLASGSYATVSGGNENSASSNWSVVAGGDQNDASAWAASVGGGYSNWASGTYTAIAGGYQNVASGINAAVGGGRENVASGVNSMAPGGYGNLAAGNYTFAAGRRAKTNAHGAFVWADSLDFDFAPGANNAFTARTTGGARFILGVDGTGAWTWQCTVYNGGSWGCSSDRNVKENFQPVDGRAILEKLATLPITTWNAIGTDPNVRRMGPMSQDFYAAFGLGDDDKVITTGDLDGVALASIQGLYQIVQEKDAQIASLEARLAALEQLIQQGAAPSGQP